MSKAKNKPTALLTKRYHGLFHLLLTLIFGVMMIWLPPQNTYAWRSFTEAFSTINLLPIPTPAPIPLNITGTGAPNVTAEGIVIVDVGSSVRLYEKNPGVRLFPASTTKIMTAVISLEDFALDDVVKVNRVINEGQVTNLVKGEKITVENLLYAILIHSANDAAYALVDHHSGGEAEFIKRMNEKAAALNLSGTHFTNPVGFDDQNHYTTAKDLANLSMFALRQPLINKIVGIPQITVADTTFSHFHQLKNVNELLGKIPGVSGFKTGFTPTAGQALVTTIQRQDHKVLIVLLKSQDRFGETEQLVNWVFGNFSWQELQPEKI